MNFLKQTFGYMAFLLIIGRGTGGAFEKVGTTSFQFLKIATDARSTAMGEAFSSVVNSSQAVFWNPGALIRIQKFDLQASHLNWLLDTKHTSLAVALRIGDIGVLGFHGLFVDMGSIQVTRVDHLGFIGDDYNPGLTGEVIQPSAMSVGISYARSYTDKFSFGLTAKLVREDLVVQNKSRLMFDMGLIYDTGYRSMQLSAVVRHFGPEVRYVDKSYPLPQTFSLGLSAYLIGKHQPFWFDSQTHSLLIAYDLTHPRDYDQQHHIGVEYAFSDLLILRAGYKFNYDEESLTLGFGVKFKNVRLDYSYSNLGPYLNAVNRFSFGIRLD